MIENIPSEAVDDLITEAKGAVRDARVAARDQRTPPWKTPEGKARAKDKKRKKNARASRKRNR